MFLSVFVSVAGAVGSAVLVYGSSLGSSADSVGSGLSDVVNS